MMKKYLMTASALALLASLAVAAPQVQDHEHGELEAVTTLKLPEASKVTMLRMKNGSILWGEIQSHTPDGITFTRLDSGGIATLAWTFLDPGQEAELRLQYGYVDLDGDEVMATADRIAMIDGTEMIGRILERTPTTLILKTSFSSSIPIPVTRVRAISSVTVPASEIFTRDELYVQELVTRDPESAQDQYELARFCERILDYAHAVEHYTLAITLDPTFREQELLGLRERAQVRAELQDQLDFLAQIDSFKRRKRFDAAFDLIAEFPELYPGSPLQDKLIRLRDRTLKARDRFMVDAVRKRWLYVAGRLAREAALTMPVDEAQSYAADGLSEEILASVTEHVGKWARDIPTEEIRKYWGERKKSRYRSVTYGTGTWLLGEAAALKGETPQEEEDSSKPLTDTQKQRKALEEKLSVFMENRQRRQRSRANADDSEDRDQWWTFASLNERQRWIFAYYIENAGDFEVKEKPILHNCRVCGGTGVREIIYTGGFRQSDNSGGGRSGRNSAGDGIGIEECGTCRGIGRTRRIQYR